jgi:hypothetical protein
MSEMEDKLNSILSNPEMMSQIMSMAQSMGASAPPATASKPDPLPGIDLNMLQKLSGIAQSTNVDKNQQTLLHALSPYLPGDRIGRLERAMRAAKMAKLATGFLGQRGLQF